jgi:hypothetical protein
MWWRLAILLWVILGTTLAGIGVMVVLATPSMSSQAMMLIPYAAAIGAVIGIPISIVGAKMIAARTPA